MSIGFSVKFRVVEIYDRDTDGRILEQTEQAIHEFYIGNGRALRSIIPEDMKDDYCGSFPITVQEVIDWVRPNAFRDVRVDSFLGALLPWYRLYTENRHEWWIDCRIVFG